MSPLTEIHVAFKSLFGLKHPIKEINGVSRKGLQLMLTQSQAIIHPATMLATILVEIHGVSKVRSDFFFAQFSLIIKNTFCKT